MDRVSGPTGRAQLYFSPKSVQPGEEDPARLHAEDRDPAEMRAGMSAPLYGAMLPQAVRKTTGGGTELPVPGPAVRQRALGRDG